MLPVVVLVVIAPINKNWITQDVVLQNQADQNAVEESKKLIPPNFLGITIFISYIISS